MDKNELRRLYRSKRAQISETQIAQLSEAIRVNLFSQFNFSQISSVHIFLPMENRKEIDTYKIIHQLWEHFPQTQVVVPKMLGDNMESIPLNKYTILKSNELGIPEPLSEERFSNNELKMVLLPLLVYDKKGNRIGYGKGFYDRFLSQCDNSIIKVGLSFFEPEESIPSDKFDIPINFCVTPTEIHVFSND